MAILLRFVGESEFIVQCACLSVTRTYSDELELVGINSPKCVVPVHIFKILIYLLFARKFQTKIIRFAVSLSLPEPL